MPEFGPQERDRNQGPRRRSDRQGSDRQGSDRQGSDRQGSDRQGSGGRRKPRPDSSGRPADRGKSGRDQSSAEAQQKKPKQPTPVLPEGAEYGALDPEIRRDLGGLPKQLAEQVGAHLAAAGMLLHVDPDAALAHARHARGKAARVAVVREAAGLTAYQAGEWAEALAELRAVRRMSGHSEHVAVMADCERALGRPERALELAAEARAWELPQAEAIELRIVAAGARRDMGQLDAAVVALQGPDLNPARHEPWSARLFYAYADNLTAAGRTDEAVRWFVHAAQADVHEETDAAERAVELAGEAEDALDLAALVDDRQQHPEQHEKSAGS